MLQNIRTHVKPLGSVESPTSFLLLWLPVLTGLIFFAVHMNQLLVTQGPAA